MDQRFQHRPNMLNLLEEELGDILQLLGVGKDFLKRMPVVQVLRSTTDKWELLKLKASVQQRTPSLK